MAKQKDANGKSTAYGDGLINIIAKGTKITGDVEIDNDFRLDGEIDGNIISKAKVIIGEKGVLRGSLQCVNAEVIGKITGNITADSLSLWATAMIEGDVKTKFLTIEPGAVFNGTCSMKSKLTEKETDKKL